MTSILSEIIFFLIHFLPSKKLFELISSLLFNIPTHSLFRIFMKPAEKKIREKQHAAQKRGKKRKSELSPAHWIHFYIFHTVGPDQGSLTLDNLILGRPYQIITLAGLSWMGLVANGLGRAFSLYSAHHKNKA